MTVISIDQTVQTGKPPRVSRAPLNNPAWPAFVKIEWGPLVIGLAPEDARALAAAINEVL